MGLNKIKFSSIWILFLISNTYATELFVDSNESAISSNIVSDGFFENDVSVLAEEADIKQSKQYYISPYNYLQDPISLNMGYSSVADSANGTFRGGTSVILGQNRPVGTPNMTISSNVFQLWGQTGRLGGFALGGAATGVVNFRQASGVDTWGTTTQLAPSQAYINYQYPNKVDVSAGNILITTPWVNSFGSTPGATYAMGNNTYQGVLVNAQLLPSLLAVGFSAWGYLQYPNYLPNQQNFYNSQGSSFLNGIDQTTSYGPSGVGLIWNPVDSYTGELWLYNFSNYANMAYVNNSYHIPISDLFSFDLGLQGFVQASSGNNNTNQVYLPGQDTPAGLISSNGTGLKIALNIGDNTTSISFNNIFGSGFLNGGMVTPYTYGMETDPLYTTPALTSLAELGSGYAFTLRNSTTFMDKNLKFNISASQFNVNQVFEGQATQVNEYDAALLYRIPHTNMNVWTRMVYLQQPQNAGGNMWQPRVIYNWTF